MVRRFAPVLLAGVVALAGRSASAYVRTATTTGAPMYWNRTVMDIVVYVGNPPPVTTSEEILTAATEAAAAWSRDQVGCTALQLRVTDSPEESASVELDGVNRVTFRRDEWCKEPRGVDEPCYAMDAMAVTSVFARRNDGEILDADTEINAVAGNLWSDLVARPEDASRAQDLQNTLTHEFGHFIGMDHTCYLTGDGAGLFDDHGRPVPSCADASPAIRETTMFAEVGRGDIDRRTLTTDDLNAVCDVYPPLDPVLIAESAGCATAPGSRSSFFAALASAVGLLIVVRRRRRAARPRPATGSSTDPWRPR